MTIKYRPDIDISLNPLTTTYARSNGTSQFSNLGVRAQTRLTETSSGTRRRKPKSRWINPTDYTFTLVDWRSCVGTSTYMPSGYPNSLGSKYVGVVGTVQGTMTRFALANHCSSGLSTESAMTDSGLRNAALIAARRKLKSTSVNLGVAYGERKQTEKLVTSTATRVANAYRALRRGNARRAMDELGISSKKRTPRGNNVPQKWLEMQYGWKPLLSDVYGSADALAKRERDDWRVTAKAMRSTILDYYSEVSKGSGAWADVVVVAHKSCFVRIDCVPTNEVVTSLASLGCTNPLEVAWELVPYSFVVDWFLPIGNYLSSLDAMLGYSCKGYSSSLFNEVEWTVVGRSGPGTSGSQVENNFTGGKKMVYLNRVTGTSTPIPTLPSFKDPRSLGHMANALALLAGAFGRR